MTCSTSEVPMPKAKQAKAPLVEVCESPQTMVMPGKVAPSSGANHVHYALVLGAHAKFEHIKIGAITIQGYNLQARYGVLDFFWSILAWRSGNAVVSSSQVGAALPQLAPGQPQTLKGLG